MTEDKTVGWHHQLNGHEFEQAPVDGDEQGSLARYRPWCHDESDMTERPNNKKVPLSKAMVNKSMVFPVVMYGCELSSLQSFSRI